MSRCYKKHCCRPCCRTRCRRRAAPVFGGIRISRGVLLALLFFLAGRNLGPAGQNENVNVVNIGGEDIEDIEDIKKCKPCKPCKSCDDIYYC